jgi:hypothetical protein
MLYTPIQLSARFGNEAQLSFESGAMFLDGNVVIMNFPTKPRQGHRGYHLEASATFGPKRTGDIFRLDMSLGVTVNNNASIRPSLAYVILFYFTHAIAIDFVCTNRWRTAIPVPHSLYRKEIDQEY